MLKFPSCSCLHVKPKGMKLKIVLATSNKGKIKEIKAFLKEYDVVGYTHEIEPFEIVEDGSTFKENALIKARAVYEKLPNKNVIVLADDSGISVPVLNNEPGIYSARYAGAKASDKDNLQKLIDTLKSKNISKTPAFYTAAIALATPWGQFSVHGWMHGDAIDEAKGKNGFGYDPIFIPHGFMQTLAQMDEAKKIQISHRTQALTHALTILNSLKGMK
jgi:XTP/dITP diphosphohydrolase